MRIIHKVIIYTYLYCCINVPNARPDNKSSEPIGESVMLDMIIINTKYCELFDLLFANTSNDMRIMI